MRKLHKYTPGELEWLRLNYRHMLIRDMAAHIGVNEAAMQQKLHNMGLRKKRQKAGPHVNTVDGKSYWRITVGNRKVHLHRLNYEAKHGPVPEGHLLSCVDGNTLNADADNWVPITRGENMMANLNHAATSASLKKLWARVKLREQYGRPVHFCKFRSKRNIGHTQVFAHEPNRG